MEYDRANAVQRAVRRFASSGPGAWLFVRLAHRLDKPFFRLSKGRFTLASLIAGLPVVMLTTTGARTGKPRTVPVLGLPSPEGLAVIASKFGQRDTPGWCHNLLANPEGEVAVDGQRRRVRAIEVEGDRRRRVWEHALTIYPGYEQYAKRAAHRRIHVFVLE
jgi:deazaflavin-dependent oxidoreductase (nitroreductase family)